MFWGVSFRALRLRGTPRFIQCKIVLCCLPLSNTNFMYETEILSPEYIKDNIENVSCVEFASILCTGQTKQPSV